jgi:3'-phosphoadenosine 5'-phosphosulfate sulfotransferase (PAPS reductase)/FAD synthetase
MKQIVSFSGGKDSTAMLLKMLEDNWIIDEIIFCDTGKEFPQIYRHIEKVKAYIKEKYNKEITTLKAEKNFDYYMFEHVKTRGKNKGKKGYGWATMRARWCTTLLKNNVIDNYLKKYKEIGYTEYIGIAYDEPKRIKNKSYPLVEYEMTEKDCLQYCYEKGFDWERSLRTF